MKLVATLAPLLVAALQVGCSAPAADEPGDLRSALNAAGGMSAG
jgi:hypothetical protein